MIQSSIDVQDLISIGLIGIDNSLAVLRQTLYMLTQQDACSKMPVFSFF